jgi:hypothetical protein
MWPSASAGAPLFRISSPAQLGQVKKFRISLLISAVEIHDTRSLPVPLQLV